MPGSWRTDAWLCATTDTALSFSHCCRALAYSWLELLAEVGDGLRGRRRRIVGVFAPPLLQQRSDTPCPMLPSSSCFSQGRLLTRSPKCCATERAPYWRKRSRPRSPSSSPSTPI